MHVAGFNLVSVSLNFQFCQCQTQLSVSDSISFFRFWLYRYRFQVTLSLSVSKLRSLERGGVSELSQAQVDRYRKPSGSALASTPPI